MMVLEAKDLKKYYELGSHKVKALGGVSITVLKGEFVGIMGPSGSGKSTLLQLLGGLDRPSEGAVYLAGENVSGLSDQKSTLLRRRNIGFVFQFYNLLPTLSAEENILLPLIIDGKNPKDYEENLVALLERVGLTSRRNHKPNELSGGEQQRVALARALITSPAIILADEPTGNLDSKTGRQVMHLLAELSHELDQTIIMVTHDPRAAAFADRLILLEDGSIRNEISFSGEQDHAERLHLIMADLEGLE